MRLLSWTAGAMPIAEPMTVDDAECHPVPERDRQLYDDWGAEQSPPLEWVSCAERCQHKLRICHFRERPPSAREQLRVATCNGRDVGPPCQLLPD